MTVQVSGIKVVLGILVPKIIKIR